MGSSKYRLIQWNYRGIKPRYEELLLLLTLLRPSVFCLQETYLKPEDNFTIKTFNTYNHIHSDCLRASGGSSILVNSSLPQREIKLKTDLQAVAVSVTLEKEITLCSVYIPPSFSTPYNRLPRRQITASTTDQGKFSGKGVGEVFLFAKINKRICGLQLMMENIFNVWRYCSSNLTLFHVQISFLSACENLRFKNIAQKTAFCFSRTSTKQII